LKTTGYFFTIFGALNVLYGFWESYSNFPSIKADSLMRIIASAICMVVGVILISIVKPKDPLENVPRILGDL
jgi:tetrahydromethanopterin S-methyltransferase subunit C